MDRIKFAGSLPAFRGGPGGSLYLLPIRSPVEEALFVFNNLWSFRDFRDHNFSNFLAPHDDISQVEHLCIEAYIRDSYQDGHFPPDFWPIPRLTLSAVCCAMWIGQHPGTPSIRPRDYYLSKLFQFIYVTMTIRFNEVGNYWLHDRLQALLDQIPEEFFSPKANVKWEKLWSGVYWDTRVYDGHEVLKRLAKRINRLVRRVDHHRSEAGMQKQADGQKTQGSEQSCSGGSSLIGEADKRRVDDPVRGAAVSPEIGVVSDRADAREPGRAGCFRRQALASEVVQNTSTIVDTPVPQSDAASASHQDPSGWAANLRKAREKKQLSRPEAAKILGFSHEAIKKHEEGKAFPKPENQDAYAEAYGRPVDELFPK